MARAIADLAEADTPERGGDKEALSQEISLAFTEGERAFAFYNAVFRTASTEAVMLEAQRLSQDTLHVISTLRSYRV